jgi:hypothetical protein
VTNGVVSGLRLLPALLLFLLRALVAAAIPAVRPVAAVPSETSAEPAPADRATVLFTQFTAGVRGSRAPPAASA